MSFYKEMSGREYNVFHASVQMKDATRAFISSTPPSLLLGER